MLSCTSLNACKAGTILFHKTKPILPFGSKWKKIKNESTNQWLRASPIKLFIYFHSKKNIFCKSGEFKVYKTQLNENPATKSNPMQTEENSTANCGV